MEWETWNFTQSNFKTIQFDTSDKTDLKDIISSVNLVNFFSINFEKRPKLDPKFWKKANFWGETVQIKTISTEEGFNYWWEAVLKLYKS